MTTPPSKSGGIQRGQADAGSTPDAGLEHECFTECGDNLIPMEIVDSSHRRCPLCGQVWTLNRFADRWIKLPTITNGSIERYNL